MQKLALTVDDSKVARMTLSKLLISHPKQAAEPIRQIATQTAQQQIHLQLKRMLFGLGLLVIGLAASWQPHHSIWFN